MKYFMSKRTLPKDEDDGENKWFVSTVAGNINFDNLEEFFSKRMLESIQLVIAATIQLLTELSNNKPSMLKSVKAGAIKGLKEGAVTLAATALAVLFGVDLYN